MIAIDSFGAAEALQALRTVNAALAKTNNELSTGRRVATVEDDSAAYVIAARLGSDASALEAVSSCLGGAEVPTTVAGAAIDNISNTLITLKQAVIGASAGGLAETDEDTQVQNLIYQIGNAVSDATVDGVNLISGTTGGAVSRTQIQVPAGLNGERLTIGGTNLSGLNASIAGLGLTGASSGLGGLNIQFSSLSVANISTASQGTAVVVQTGNYGDSSSQTAQYPGQKWTFQFTDAADPATASTTTVSSDQSGNVLQQDRVIPVALKAGFTLNDAIEGLQAALSDEGFVSRFDNGTLGIAGNNIDQSMPGTDAVINIIPSYGPETESVVIGQAARSGSTTLNYATNNEFSASSLVGGTFFQTSAEADAFLQANPTLSAFYPSTAAGIADGTTILAVDPATNDLTLSNPTRSAFAAGSAPFSAVLNGPTTVTASPWTGTDAAIATIDSAMLKTGKIAQYLSDAQSSLTQAQGRVSDAIDNLNQGIGTMVDADMGAVSAQLVAQQIRQQLAVQSLAISGHAPALLLQLF